MHTAPITGHHDKLPGHAHLLLIHRRPKMVDGRPVVDESGKFVMEEFEREEKLNLVIDTGRVQLHKQGYDTTGLATNGFNFMGLSDDATAPVAGDTDLTAEITTGGLARTQGVVVLPTGAGNQTTVKKTFTKTGSAGSVQRVALFNLAGPPVAGIINHSFQFTQRTLQVNDELDVTITITLG